MHIRWLMVGLVLCVLAATGCASNAAPTMSPELTEVPAGGAAPTVAGLVVSSGRVVPGAEVDVSFTVSGRLARLAVAEGDRVAAGDDLAALETAALSAVVSQAEAQVSAAEAALAQLEEGPRPEEVALAEAQVATAEAALARAEAQGGRPYLGATRGELDAARAQLTGAQADEIAADAFHRQTMECFNVRMPDGTKTQVCPLLGPIEERARYAWETAQKARAAAEAQLIAIQAGGAAELGAAQAGVAEATARRDAALAALDLARAGATAEQLAAARAQLSAAQARLAAAQAALAQGSLLAPCSGVVTSITAGPGEVVQVGQAVLTLADLDSLEIETTDLSERDIARVAPGQRAVVVVEALGLEFEGRVLRIGDQATTAGGEVVYPVTIELLEQPEGLRWGMTVEVDIETGG